MLRRVIDRWEPPLGDLEGDYRRHFLAGDVGLMRVAVALGVVSLILYIGADYYFFRLSALFAGLATGRLLLMAGMIVLVRRLRREAQPARVDKLVFISTLCFTALATVNFASRPATVWQADVFGVLAVFMFYTLTPQPLLYRGLSGGIYTAAMLGVMVLTRDGLTQVERVGTVAGLLGANVIGALVSIQLNNYRRQQYRALWEEQRARQFLEHLATTDSLTGVMNRRSFIEAAENEVHRFRRYGRQFAVIIIDLDFFKRINDTHGHLAGDRALLAFTALVRRTQRATDLFGRLGGEEFGLLLPETCLADAAAVAERLRADCEANVIEVDGAQVRLTLSAGVAAVTREDASLDDLMRRADTALYRAKDGERNRVEVAGPAPAKEGQPQA